MCMCVCVYVQDVADWRGKTFVASNIIIVTEIFLRTLPNAAVRAHARPVIVSIRKKTDSADTIYAFI